MQLLKTAIKRVLPTPVWQKFRSRWWRHLRPLTVDYCPVMLPCFASARGQDDISQLHRLAMAFHWKNAWSPLTSLCVAVAAAWWPFQFAGAAVANWRRHHAGISRLHGVSGWRQGVGILAQGISANVPPASYYRFRLFDADNGRRAVSYVHPDEMSVLHPTLAVDLPSDAALRDKESFFEHGRSFGLPVVPAIATFAEGRVRKWYAGATEDLPERDLVLKPVDQACGRGFQLWQFDARQKAWRRGSRCLPLDDFLAYCRDASRYQTHILQARVSNHPALAGLAGQGLSTIRIVTFRRTSGKAGVLLACLRMPTGPSPVDNFEAGGLAASIDLSTGRLGRAVAKDPLRGEFVAHPDSGAPIEGVTVPQVPEAIDVTLRAHACFPWQPFVGWDVVVTPSGPWLLEANPDWCVELAQIATRRPLGDTLYPEIYLEHLSARQGSLPLKVSTMLPGV